jgi:hypothetical protein
MDVVPMFDARAASDAWHHVTAPGGYEQWQCDAESLDGRLRVVAVLGAGFAFDGDYRRRYARYRRSPTKHRPPTAGEYPVAHAVLYEDGRVVARSVARFAPEAFAAAADRLDVRVGPNRLWREADGTLRLALAGRGAVGRAGVPPADAAGPDGADHPVPTARRGRAPVGAADPLCDVNGTVVVVGRRGDGGRRAQRPRRGSGRTGRRQQTQTRDAAAASTSSAAGITDHQYGTAPIDHRLAWRIWGRVIDIGENGSGDERAYVFQMARSQTPDRPDEVHLICADAGGQHGLAVTGAADWGRPTFRAPAYPNVINLSPHLRLYKPRVIDGAGAAGTRLVYDAAIDGGARRGIAFCEDMSQRWPRWPALGRLLGSWTHWNG